MIDLLQWRVCASIGCFNSRVNDCISCEFISSTNVVLLHAVVTVMCNVAALQTYMYTVTSMLLLLCRDIDTYRSCMGQCTKFSPNCDICCHIKRKSCACGHIFYKKTGGEMGYNLWCWL